MKAETCLRPGIIANNLLNSNAADHTECFGRWRLRAYSSMRRS